MKYRSNLQRSRRQKSPIQGLQLLEQRLLMSYTITPNSAVIMNTSLGEIAVQFYNDGSVDTTVANFLKYVTAGEYNGTFFHRSTNPNDSSQDQFSILQGGGFSSTSPSTAITNLTTPSAGISTGLTSGTSYSTITLNAALAAALPSGTQLTIGTGSTAQTVTLSAAASTGDTTLNVTAFTPTTNFSSGAIVQGTGFTTVANGITNQYTDAHPNTAGTIAMARTNALDSATSQFFFNVSDNSSAFGSSNPYAVFGDVIRGEGIVQTIDNLTTQNLSTTDSNSALTNVPETSTG
ncbi:MAG TPA: peptidylprolyl isomerase, partial [Tepidisphaeraceae bacterium]|nr:peptidylprolyl isomerase [Tepidisphaeraceae bacterium]